MATENSQQSRYRFPQGAGRALSTARDYDSGLTRFAQLVVDSSFADECLVEACLPDTPGTWPPTLPERTTRTPVSGVGAATPRGALCVLRVALVARGAVLGGMSLLRFGPARAYTEADREAADVLGWCAALLVDNAGLVEAAHASRAKAEKAARFRHEFFSLMSHELRTPLTAVLGWASILVNGDLDDQRRRYAAEVIERNARAETRLVQNLLDGGLLLSGELRLRPDAMRPIDLVARAVESMGDAARARNVRLELVVAQDPGTVVADAERLHQVLACLLSSAIERTPAGGRVALRLGCIGDDVAFCVEDEGDAIEPRLDCSLFDAELPTDAAMQAADEASLDVTVARRLVELHGGTIDAFANRPGKGATFLARIPALADRSDSTCASGLHSLTARPARPPAGGSGRTAGRAASCSSPLRRATRARCASARESAPPRSHRRRRSA
jgi:K+-sensing histidine kinase KdpD